MTDYQLVEEAKAGDQLAFRTLYDSNVDRVYRLAYRMTGEPEVAKDLAQETFLRAFERLDQFRGDAAFSTWLHSIAVSVGQNWLRKAGRRRKRMQSMEGTAPPAPARIRVEPDLRDRLNAAVEELPEAYKTVFLMYDLEGYTHSEIGAALGVAEGTSKARLSRARAQLRESLGEQILEYL